MKTYTEASAFLGAKENRPLTGRETRLIHRDADTIAVCYHETDVVTYHSNGDVTLNSGGWQTATTKERLNEYAPCHIWQDKGVWTVHFGGNVYSYRDGMTLHADGAVTGAGDNDAVLAAKRALYKRIDQYVALYADQTIRGLVEEARRDGTAGDCWLCAGMIPGGSSDHLEAHIEESHTMVTLILNAYKAKRYGNPAFVMNWHIDSGRYNEIRTHVRNYLRSQLAKGVAVSGWQKAGTTGGFAVR